MEGGIFVASVRGNSYFCTGFFTFQTLERIFQTVKHMFQTAKRTFQSLKYTLFRKSLKNMEREIKKCHE